MRKKADFIRFHRILCNAFKYFVSLEENKIEEEVEVIKKHFFYHGENISVFYTNQHNDIS